MPRGQFKNSLSPEEMKLGIRMLQSDVLQRRIDGIPNVQQSMISRMRNRQLTLGDPSHGHDGERDRATTQRVQECNWRAHLYTDSLKQTP